MNASFMPIQTPKYDLSTIFRPYIMELNGEAISTSLGESKSPLRTLEAMGRSSKSIFDIETSRLPLLDSDEPLSSWLLRAAGVVSDAVMRDSLEISRTGGIRLSEVLQLSGRVSLSDLRALERAIFYVCNSSIYRGFAAIALSYALAHFVDYDEALWDLGLHPNDPLGDFSLVKLLEDCELLPQDKMIALRKECLAQGLTVGWALVHHDLMSGQLVKVLIECLSAVSTNKLDYETLVFNLKSAMNDTASGEADSRTTEAILVSRLPISTADRALGNLLLSSLSMELEDLIFCAEVALEDNRSLGSVISDFMLVDSIVLQAARTLAYMLGERKLTARRSVELLEEVKQTGRPLSQLFLEGNKADLTVVPNAAGLAAVSSIA